MKKYIYELALVILITSLLSVHFLGLIDQTMMFSGFMCLVILGYITVLFHESVLDEREEYIRNKTNRYLYILTMVLLLVCITYKTMIHVDYTSELLIVAIISIAKVFMNKFLTLHN